MKTCRTVGFTVPAGHRVKLKEYEKRDKYNDLAREMKKLWGMQVTKIPIIISTLGTATEWLVHGLGDLKKTGVEAIQTTAALRSARILRRAREPWGDVLSHKLGWETIS